MNRKRRNSEQHVDKANTSKKRKARNVAEKANAFETKFGANELVAVYSGEENKIAVRPFFVAKLRDDVLMRDSSHDQVDVLWLENDPAMLDGYELSGTSDLIVVGSIICSIEGHVEYSADGTSVRLHASCDAFVQAQLTKQLADNYNSDEDEELGDAGFQARLRAAGRVNSGYRRSGRSADKIEDLLHDGDHDPSKKNKDSKKKSRKKKQMLPLPHVTTDRVDVHATVTAIQSFNGDTLRASQQLVAAVRGRQFAVVKELLADEERIHSLAIPQSIDVPITGMWLAATLGEKDMVVAFVKRKRSDLEECRMRAPLAKSRIVQLTTGKHTSRFSNYNRYEINISRGGKQGNNAFLREETSGLSSSDIMDVRRSPEFDPLLDCDSVPVDILQAMFCDRWNVRGLWDVLPLEELALGGNRLAIASLLQAFEHTCGFNFLHFEVLGDAPDKMCEQSGPFSKSFRAASVIKKGDTPNRLTPIHLASINPNTAYLEHLLRVDPSAHGAQDLAKRTLLHFAASCVENDAAPLRYLLKNCAGLDLNAFDKGKTTPLIIASRCGNAAGIRVLLNAATCDSERRLMLDHRETRGWSALLRAVRSQRSTKLDAVRALLDAGADVDMPASPAREKICPVHIAAMIGDVGTMEVLRDFGADLAAVDKLGRTTAVHAAANGHVPALAQLLPWGVDPTQPDTSGNTPLHYAAAYGWTACVRLLVDRPEEGGAGIEPNALNSWKTTPMSLAVQKGKHDVARFLLETERVDINLVDAAGDPLLFTCVRCYLEEISDAVSPLKCEKFSSQPWTLRALLNKPSLDVTIRDVQGNSVLHVIASVDMNKACAFHQEEALALAKGLIDRGAPVNCANAANDQATVLAAKYGNIALMKLLLPATALATCIDADGNTLAHHALAIPKGRILQAIFDLDKAAFRDMTRHVNGKGQTPLVLAAHMVASTGASQDCLNALLFLLEEGSTATEAATWIEMPQEDVLDPLKLATMLLNKSKDKTNVLADINCFLPCNKAGVRNALHVLAAGLSRDPQKALHVLRELAPFLKKYASLRKQLVAAHADDSGLTPLLNVLAFAQTQVVDDGSASGKENDQMDVKYVFKSDDDDERLDEDEDELSSADNRDFHGEVLWNKNEPEFQAVSGDWFEVIEFWVNTLGADINQGARHLFASQTEMDTFQHSAEADAALVKMIEAEATKVPATETLVEKFALLMDLRRKRAFKGEKATLQMLPTSHALLRRGQGGLLQRLNEELDLEVTNVDHARNTAVHVAIESGTAANVVAWMCIEFKKLCSVPNAMGVVPLHLAAVRNEPTILKAVLDALSVSEINAKDNLGKTPLHISVCQAVQRTNESLESCELLLVQAGANVNTQDMNGRTPLHYAFIATSAKNEELLFNFPHDMDRSKLVDPIQVVSVLCNANDGNVNVSIADESGRTPLHYACSIGATVSALLLLGRGASLHVLDKDGNSALAVAILCKLATFTILMLKSNSVSNDLANCHMVHDVRRLKVKVTRNKKEGIVKIKSREVHSFMWYAIRYELDGVVTVVLDDFPHEQAIADALDCGSFQLVRTLLSICKRSVVVATNPETRISFVHRLCSVDDFRGEPKWGSVLCTKLVELGVDPRALDHQRRSALHIAASRGHLPLCQHLIETYSLDKDAIDSQGRTALASFLCASKRTLLSDVAVELTELLFSTACTTFDAETSLVSPALCTSFKIFGGPNISTVTAELKDMEKDGKGSACVSRTVRSSLVIMGVLSENLGVLDMLLRKNADAEKVDSDGFRALHYAVGTLQSAEAVELLLRHGANPNSSSNAGLTPLMLAVERNNMDIMELLLRFGADPTVCQKNGETVLHHAARSSRAPEQFDMLVDATRWVASKSPPVDAAILPDYSAKGADVLVRFDSEPRWHRAVVGGCNSFQLTILKSADEHKAEVKALLIKAGYDKSSISRLLNSGKVKNLADIANRANFEEVCCEVGAWGNLSRVQVPPHSEQSNKWKPPSMNVSEVNATIVAMPDALFLEPKKLEAELLLCASAVPKLAGQTDDQLRKELERFAGAEYLLIGGEHEALTKPFADNDAVLVVEDSGTLREAVVLRTNANKTVDLRLVRGSKRLGVRRIQLRPSFGCLALTCISTAAAKTAAVKFVGHRNVEGRTALEILLSSLKLGEIDGAFANCAEAAAVLRPYCKAVDVRRAAEQTVARSSNHLARVLGLTGKQRPRSGKPVPEMSAVALAADVREALKDRESRGMSAFVDVPPPIIASYLPFATAGMHVLAVAVSQGEDKEYYDVVLSKVDVSSGLYGVNVYYRMQIVCDPLRELYLLITNWGRIDEYGTGKYQASPYSKLEAVAEFSKLYKSKTGNKWEDRHGEFVHVAKKYARVNMLHHRVEYPQLPCLVTSPALDNPSALPKALQETMRTWTSPVALESAGKHWGINDSALPLGKLSMETLLDAEHQLELIRGFLKRKNQVMQNTPIDIPALRYVMERIAKTTNSFLQLLPMKEHDDPVKPFDETTFRRAVTLVYGLKEVTTATELVLAASRQKQIHPLDYCYRALGACIQALPEDDSLRRCVEQYARNTCGDEDILIWNVYTVTRNEDLKSDATAKMHTLGNKRLLWHGTHTANVLGIIKNGLQVVPEEAPQCGATFGRGIYLADMLAKSYPYCRGWTRIGKRESPRAYLFLVEAALGKPLRVTHSHPFGSMDENETRFDSIIGVGRIGPEPSCDVLLGDTETAIPLGGTVLTKDYKLCARRWVGSTREINQHDSSLIEEARLDPGTTFPAIVHLSDGRLVILEEGVDGWNARITTSVTGNTDKTERIWRTADSNPDCYLQHHEYIVPLADQVQVKYIVEVTSKKWIRDMYYENKTCLDETLSSLR